MSNSDTEFKVAQKLKGHPNIIQIYSYEKDKPITIQGQQTNRDYMSLELCKNGDLFDFMRKYNDYKTKLGYQVKGLLIDDLGLLRSMYF